MVSNPPVQWQVHPLAQLPEAFVKAVEEVTGNSGLAIAQLLWQRGIREPEQVAGFLNSDRYQPTSAFAFGQEMDWAIGRLRQAYEAKETIAIWGDFDADGITATAVLWDGLGQFFPQHKTLFYYIPNRLTESHGLSHQGLDQLHQQGCRLIVTCDTGSTNLEEIAYAGSLGIDVIITDHHTLPSERPPVVALINPRYLPPEHPLGNLSGVAVAYKLVEALYESLPTIPTKPLHELLDLVAIGLIADLVELRGDCRYLAQKGIQQLQRQSDPKTASRPGVAKLLELCKRSGDRPTDISFGLGPRINAVSRIQGDAHFCVELLTSQDAALCNHLAEATELANARRKALQKEVMEQVRQRLSQLDLSTTSVIVLADEQWQTGVLGLVAGQIAQEYGRPTILLSIETNSVLSPSPPPPPLPIPSPLARGSARSVDRIDLYQLVQNQQHLLTRFGGHPFAAGLSLPLENLSLFTAAVNQQLRQSGQTAEPIHAIDLEVKVADLGKALFQELKLLEPCGIGNPVPRLLICDCWFENAWHRKIKDRKGQKVEYIKTEFQLCDASTSEKFPGTWWGHYRDEIPQGRCDAIVELDFNTYADEAKGIKPHYEVRLVAVRPQTATFPDFSPANSLLDWRDRISQETSLTPPLPPYPAALLLERCPSSWGELQAWFRKSQQQGKPLALAFPSPSQTPPPDTWQKLVGIAKYLSRTGNRATRQQMLDKLEMGDHSLYLGIKTLSYLGFAFDYSENAFTVTWVPPQPPPQEREFNQALQEFFVALQEEHFRRQYFYQVPLETIRAMATQTGAN
jgi:single-stranded-DNA-specific exonuclease